VRDQAVPLIRPSPGSGWLGMSAGAGWGGADGFVGGERAAAS
jgi:hypothetical protein